MWDYLMRKIWDHKALLVQLWKRNHSNNGMDCTISPIVDLHSAGSISQHVGSDSPNKSISIPHMDSTIPLKFCHTNSSLNHVNKCDNSTSSISYSPIQFNSHTHSTNNNHPTQPTSLPSTQPKPSPPPHSQPLLPTNKPTRNLLLPSKKPKRNSRSTSTIPKRKSSTTSHKKLSPKINITSPTSLTHGSPPGGDFDFWIDLNGLAIYNNLATTSTLAKDYTRPADGSFKFAHHLSEATTVWEFGQALGMVGSATYSKDIKNLLHLDSPDSTDNSSENNSNYHKLGHDIITESNGLATVNVRVLGGAAKKRVVRNMVRKENLDFLCIQETKLEFIDYHLCSTLWDGSDFDWIFQPSIGRSGGLLCIWKTDKFQKSSFKSGKVMNEHLEHLKMVAFSALAFMERGASSKAAFKNESGPTAWSNPCSSHAKLRLCHQGFGQTLGSLLAGLPICIPLLNE
ncbi:hypothetical protein Lal_00043725 [Lupinus albus]|nr:hypothetical protein Lal_00043725 [Lupinus albus]